MQQQIELLSTLLWEIWKGKNDYLFKGRKSEPMATFNKASILSKEYLSAIALVKPSLNPIKTPNLGSRWRPPHQGILKYNVDVTFSTDKKIGTIAALIRDHQGRLIIGKAKHILITSSVA